MKKRPNGFLREHYEPETEVGNYIRELHEYMWRWVQTIVPYASGDLKDYVDIALKEAEARRDAANPNPQ